MKLPEDKGLKSVQISLDIDKERLNSLKKKALNENESGNPQEYVRGILGLGAKPTRRPRFGISLSESEISELAEQFDIDPNDRTALKRAIKEKIESDVGDES